MEWRLAWQQVITPRKLAMEAMIYTLKVDLLCVQTLVIAYNEMQQAYEFLRPEWEGAKRGHTFFSCIAPTRSDGHTDNGDHVFEDMLIEDEVHEGTRGAILATHQLSCLCSPLR